MLAGLVPDAGCLLRGAQVAAGAVLGVVVGYLVGVSWSHPLPMPVP